MLPSEANFLIEYMDGLPSDSESGDDFEGYIDLDEAFEATLHHTPSDASPDIDMSSEDRFSKEIDTACPSSP